MAKVCSKCVVEFLKVCSKNTIKKRAEIYTRIEI